MALKKAIPCLVLIILYMVSLVALCSARVRFRIHDDSPIPISFLASHGTDKFLYSTLQEKICVIADASPLPDSNGDTIVAELLEEKGNAAYERKQFNKAVSYYTEAIKINEKNGTYYSNRAATFLELGCFRQAEEDCSKALSLDTKNVNAYLRRGTARELLSFYEEAFQDFKHALVLEPQNKVASLAVKRLRIFTTEALEAYCITNITGNHTNMTRGKNISL